MNEEDCRKVRDHLIDDEEQSKKEQLLLKHSDPDLDLVSGINEYSILYRYFLPDIENSVEIMELPKKEEEI
jgi:hypothetical protein